MNGAESLLRTLVAAGVDLCLANPGTSEMHFVAALDRVPAMRAVLCLFEGVATGAADGYGRMTGRPASTLLHLGPGLANGLANLHNAARANTPIVNVIGDHATYHRAHDAPLTADVEGTARPYSSWVRTSPSAAAIARDAAEAVAAARTPPGGIASLILPADTAWTDSPGPHPPIAAPAPAPVDPRAVERTRAALGEEQPAALLLDGAALNASALELAGRIATVTGARLLVPYGAPRVPRGAGSVPLERVPFGVDQARSLLQDLRHLVQVAARPPVAFFAYPGKPSVLTPPGCNLSVLARPDQDVLGALESLAAACGALRARVPRQPAVATPAPGGRIVPAGLGAALAAALVENTIVVDEAVTSGRGCFAALAGAPPHDWLVNVGGSIGAGLPLATGAALACPERPVLCLSGDGSALYTPQALWTMAREALAVTVVICANRSYAILKGEMHGVGASNEGRAARELLELDRPVVDWISLARGLGVPARRVEDLGTLTEAVRHGLASGAPSLIEAVL